MRTNESIDGAPICVEHAPGMDPAQAWQAWVNVTGMAFPVLAAFGETQDAAIEALKARYAVEVKDLEA